MRSSCGLGRLCRFCKILLVRQEIDRLMGRLPSDEVVACGCSIGFGIGACRWLEEEKNWCGLQHQLVDISELSPMSHLHLSSYRLEGILAIQEIQSCVHESRLSLLVPFCPRLRQQIPLRLEIMAQSTSKSCVQRCEKHCNRIVPWGLRHLAVGSIVELDGFQCRDLFGMVVFVSAAGRLLGCQCAQRQ